MIRGSYFFNTSASQYLSLSGDPAFAIATTTTPFTVEAWIRLRTSGGRILSEGYPGSGSVSLVFGLCDGTSVQNQGLFLGFGYYTGTTWVSAACSTTELSLHTWTHVACVFTGSTSRVYINGLDRTKTSSPTPAATWPITGVNGDIWYIGRRWDTSAGGTYIDGFIHDLRFVNGSAVYTANFTPSTGSLSSIANTVVLTCSNYENESIDRGPNNFTITNVNGVTGSSLLPTQSNFVGEATIASEEFNAAQAEKNRSGMWSTVEISPKY